MAELTQVLSTMISTSSGHSRLIGTLGELLSTLAARQNAMIELLDAAGILTREDLEKRVLQNLARDEQRQAEERDRGLDSDNSPDAPDSPDAAA